MAASKITYSDKVGITPKETHINQVWDDDMNEIKLKVNDNADLFDTLETEVDANTAGLSLQTYQATVTADVEVDASLVSLALATYSADVSMGFDAGAEADAELNINVGVVNLSLATYPASVSMGFKEAFRSIFLFDNEFRALKIDNYNHVFIFDTAYRQHKKDDGFRIFTKEDEIRVF